MKKERRKKRKQKIHSHSNLNSFPVPTRLSNLTTQVPVLLCHNLYFANGK